MKAGKKRILIAVSTYPPAFGGSGLQVHRLYTRLAERLPIGVTALTESGRGQPAGDSWYEGVRIRRVDRASSLLAQFFAVGRLMLAHGPRSFDLLHASDGPPIVLWASIWARLLGIPIIREMTLPVEKRPIAAWKAHLFRSTYTSAALVFGVNDSVRAEYMAMGVPQERVRMNPYPVDVGMYRYPTQEERTSARAAFGFTEDAIVHFILGRIQPRKNQSLAVETLALLPDDHKLILAGPVGDEAYLDEIRTAIKEHGLDNRVVIIPENQQSPLPLYHTSDIYLVPSVREGGPNVMLEALCCGVPVIANESIGVQRYALEGFSGFNVALDPGEFARAAKKLTGIVKDRERRRAIAEESAHILGAPALDPHYAQQIASVLRI